MRCLLFTFAAFLPLLAGPVLSAERDDYTQQIKPLFQTRCYACHGALKQESGLRLDTVQLMVTGGDSGPAIVRGDAAASHLLERVTESDISLRMPPEQEGEPLTRAQIDLIRKWIAAGAPAPENEQPETDPEDHWAFQPIRRPDVPGSITNGSTPTHPNPIDAFVAQQHNRHQLRPQPRATRLLQLRRLYLDLIGVPPSHSEIIEFLRDDSELAYQRTVRRLLDDPRYGERWGRHWMDIWRYSDWWGLGQQLRNSQHHIWHWRDWIIESLNNDTPYDEMVRLMLAADELHPNDLDRHRATGFLARNYFLFNRPQWMEETVEHVGKGLLGLTLNCAKCHDHKFDPIEQTDFYRMRAFFEPYHVRLDAVPGQTDLAQDGIPRVFDGLLDDPTYVYIRGDEKNPDESTVIKPGVPKLLAFKPLDIQPVTLPPEAWQPQRRDWVLNDHIEADRKRVETATTQLAKADQKLQTAQAALAAAVARKNTEADEPNARPSAPLLTDAFATLDLDHWKLYGGDWQHSAGKLSQRRDGATRSALRFLSKPPRDFEITVRFTILGGSRWRSVSVCFDASENDPTQDKLASYYEQNVYVSAYAGGSKVHAAYNSGGKWHYPPGDAVRTMPIRLNEEYTFQVRVRGSLINASLNGEPVIAHQTPQARRDGAMQLTTFDALVDFHEVQIRPLDPSTPMRSPGTPTGSPATAQSAVDIAQAEHQAAEANLKLAAATLAATQQRAAAWRAIWNDADESEQSASHTAAIKAQRHASLAKARHDLAAAKLALLRAVDDDKRKAAQTTLDKAEKAVQAADQTVQAEVKPTDKLQEFVGARWTATRFFNSGKDDPTVKFPPTSSGRRTALARWITDRANPLTARVAVNHIWTRHMGQPLVATVFDFGRKGAKPTHPQLLDWLAVEFMEHGWSMKHLHFLITTSEAYRRSSSVTGGEANAARDPENKLLWRRPSIRLESQVIRDAVLALAGDLEGTLGGPPVPRAQQSASKRRSLYFFHSNNERNLFLTMFDEALVKDCYRREQSIVPQQALALTNSQLVLDSSSKIAARISASAADERAFIRAAFAVVLGIDANEEELAASSAALESWRSQADGSAESARGHLIWALINHNDFVTLR